MRTLCIICFWINIVLAATYAVTGGSAEAILLSLVCAGLCLPSYMRK